VTALIPKEEHMAEPSSTLVLAVVQPEDAEALLGALAERGCGATYLTARGGFLNRHAVAVLALTPKPRIPAVIEAIGATCSRRTALVMPVAEAEFGYVPEPIEVEIGGAVVFGLPVASVAAWGLSGIAAWGLSGIAAQQVAAVGAVRVVGPGTLAVPLSDPKEVEMISHEPTKLIVAIVPDRAASRVVAALVERRFGATTIGSTGGFLRRGNTTILTGVPAEQADEAAGLIESSCRQPGETASADGGVVFALEVDWKLRV
jgi:uncharacterized protein YaaQ